MLLCHFMISQCGKSKRMEIGIPKELIRIGVRRGGPELATFV